MFKFDFNSETANETAVDKQDATQWKESEEIKLHYTSGIDNILNTSKINTLTINNTNIKYLASTDVLNLIKTEENNKNLSVLNAEQNHSDLVTAVYEGGLKIWECTYDLINLIHKKNIDFKNTKVLDLGCGSGIVGILTYLLGSECYFQDYNEEVIKYITIANVLVNDKNCTKCKFYSGDWKSFLNLLQPNFVKEDSKFDYIFTSETIYNTDNYFKLHEVFKNLLKRSGKIYLAAKSYYFGVGGGVSLFTNMLEKENVFNFVTCWSCSEGVKRDILEITFK